MKFNSNASGLFLFLFLSATCFLFSCQEQQSSSTVENIEFLSNHSWGKIAFPLPNEFSASENCQLLWSEAFMIRCYESAYGQLEIITSESNYDPATFDIFSNTIEYRLDSLNRVFPEIQLVNVGHRGTEKEQILTLEYFENGAQSKGYHLEHIIARPGNQIVFRFYAPQGEEEQIDRIRKAFESIEVFNIQK